MIGLTLFAGIALLPHHVGSASNRTTQSDPKITLAIQATSMAKALEQLSEASHSSLFTSVQTASDVITLRFKEVPLSEAMKRIADADDASWRQEGEVFRLIRTTDQVRAEKRAAYLKEVETIRKAIQKRSDALAKMPGWNSSEADLLATKVKSLIRGFNPNISNSNFYQQVSQLSQQAPIGRAMTKICAMLDPEELAQLPSSYRTVWSSHPTATQRPLPEGVMPVIEQYMAYQTQWQAAIDKYHVTPPTFGGATYWVGDFGDLQDANSPGKVTTVLLTAQKWSRDSAFSLELSAYDEKGKRIGQAQNSLSTDMSNYTDAMKDVPARPGERTIKPDPEMAPIVSQQFQATQRDPKPYPPQLLKKLLHPEDADPLSYFLSNSLIQASEIKDVNMVGILTDRAFFGSMMGEAKEITADTFIKRLGFFNTSIELKDGWLTVRPTQPDFAREDRVDRKELGRYLRRIVAGKPLTIDEHANFCLTLPPQETNFIPNSMANILHYQDTAYYDHNMLRIYALSTPEQRAKMSGGGLPFEALTESQLECVNKMVYGVNTNLQYTPPQNTDGNNVEFDWNLFYNGLMHEPTESLPNGIPPRGTLKMDVDNSFVVKTQDVPTRNYTMPGRQMDPSSLAWQKYSQEHPDLFPWMAEESQKVDLSRILYGKRLQLNFTLHFTPVLSLSYSFEEHNSSDFKSVSIDDLPADFKKQFDDAYNGLKQSYANAKPGQFNGNQRGTNPPPQ